MLSDAKAVERSLAAQLESKTMIELIDKITRLGWAVTFIRSSDDYVCSLARREYGAIRSKEYRDKDMYEALRNSYEWAKNAVK